jgi:hypothetical protein
MCQSLLLIGDEARPPQDRELCQIGAYLRSESMDVKLIYK